MKGVSPIWAMPGNSIFFRFALCNIVIFFGLGRTLQMDYLMQQKDSATTCVYRENNN